MHQKIQLSLHQMKVGQTGTVVQIMGGYGLIRRLEALGIMPGRKVTKLSSILFRGPITLKVDNAQIAIGFGMARRIFIEVDVSD